MASTSSLIKTEDRQAAQYFEQIFAWCCQQNLTSRAKVLIAGHRAAVHFNDRPDTRQLLSGLFSAHPRSSDTIWDVLIADRSGSNIPAWPWAEFFVSSNGGAFQFSLIDPNRCMLIDFETRRAILINAGGVLAHEFHIPLLRLAIALVEHHGGAILHSGVIRLPSSDRADRQNVAVALVGKGGSGKSTLIAAARARDLECLGDDFVELAQNGELRPLFRTGRLTRTSPAYHRGLDTLETYDSETDKTVHYLKDELPASAQLAAIVAPDIVRLRSEFVTEATANLLHHAGSTAQRCAQPMTRIETLAAAIPSSVGASYHRAEAVRRLTRTLADVPGFRLQITEDLDGALQEILRVADQAICFGQSDGRNSL